MKRKDKREEDEVEERPDDFEVGYCKPPRAHQFQPGKSGNPRGRPVGSRSRGSKAATYERMKQITLEEAYRPIQIRDGDKVVVMPLYRAAVRSLGLKSAAGKVGSQRLFFGLVGDLQQETRKNQQKLFEQIVVYKTEGEVELRRRRGLGLSEADMIPHPDHLIIDPVAGRVILRGPFTPEEKAFVDLRLQTRANQVRKIRGFERRLRRSPGDAELIEMIECCKRVIALIDAQMPDDRVLVEGTEGYG